MAKKIEQEIRELEKQVDFIYRHRVKIFVFVVICLMIAWYGILTK